MKLTITLVLATVAHSYLFAQVSGFSYESQLYRRIYREHLKQGKIFTSLKPSAYPGSVVGAYLDSLANADTSNTRSVFLRYLVNRHTFKTVKGQAYLLIDFLPDFQRGNENVRRRPTWINTRGLGLQGYLNNKLGFFSEVTENQAVFPDYVERYAHQARIIPGAVTDQKYESGNVHKVMDWSMSSASCYYHLNNTILIVLGHGKNFIGDGYRSMLLSDISANYPFLKITGTSHQLQYSVIWAQLRELAVDKQSYGDGFRRKWGVIHYLEWNMNRYTSVGFFEAIIWQDADESGKRGFDASYLNPVIFLKPVEGYNGSPDNAVIGINAKYTGIPGLVCYGQFLLDEFTAQEFFARRGYWANKYGWQAGLRVVEPAGIKNLDLLAEYNSATPYTYSERTTLVNYAHYNQPLAHPFGANFKEVIASVIFKEKRFRISFQANYSLYGLDTGAMNYGKDIFKSYLTRKTDFGNKLLQGVKTSLSLMDGRLSYIINPFTDLRIELGMIWRREQNAHYKDQTRWFTIGLRSSFRKMYLDF